MVHDPHDALFKFTFSKVEHAIGELRSVLPAALVAELEWDSLELCSGSFVDSALKKSFSDVLYSVRLGGRPALIYVLMEHQSTGHPLMAFRLLKYKVRIWDEWIADHPGATQLPVIVPVVVHHSPGGWNAAVSLEDLFDLSESARAALGEHLLRMRFVLDDVSAMGNEALRARTMTAFGRVVLWSLRDARDGVAWLQGLAAWADLVREVAVLPGGRDALFALARYIHEVVDIPVGEIETIVVSAVGEEVKETMASAADRLREEGEAKGRREGEAKGRREGEAKGRRAMMRELLESRFGVLPPSAVRRIDDASEQDLGAWTRRALVAPTLAGVFGED